MADTVRTIAALQALLADNATGDISAQDVRDFLVSTYRPQIANGFRLTTESGVPVSTSDRTAQGTIYLTPYEHNCIGLYDGTSWRLSTSAEVSLALTATSGKNYDVFAYDNAGTLTLELSAAWTDDITRADALTAQDGVYVKNGATTRRWLGTIRASGANVTEDSESKRFVWNRYCQVIRQAWTIDLADHTYGSATERDYAGSSSSTLTEVVIGEGQELEVQGGGRFAADTDGCNMVVYLRFDGTTWTDHHNQSYQSQGLYAGQSVTRPYYATAGYHSSILRESSANGTNSCYEGYTRIRLQG